MSNIYIDQSAIISMSARVYNNSVIGTQTQIDKNSEIIDSVINSNCKIGSKVKIENSIIEKQVTIEDNCIIQDAII